jgi:hypothetical protein
VEASRTETRLNVPATVPTTHPNSEIRRRADGSAYTWFPGFRGNDSRQSDRLRERVQAKMKRQMRQSMTEREKMRIEQLRTFKPNREKRKP